MGQWRAEPPISLPNDPRGSVRGDQGLSGLPGCCSALPGLAAPAPSSQLLPPHPCPFPLIPAPSPASLPFPPHPCPFPRIPAQPGPVPFCLLSPLCSGLSLRKSASFCAVAAQKKLQINFCYSGACGFSAGKNNKCFPGLGSWWSSWEQPEHCESTTVFVWELC